MLNATQNAIAEHGLYENNFLKQIKLICAFNKLMLPNKFQNYNEFSASYCEMDW